MPPRNGSSDQTGTRQHYVPQFLLRNFTDEKGHVWVLDKQTDKVWPSSPANVAVRCGFYDLPSPRATGSSLDPLLQDLESRASEVVADLLGLRTLQGIEARSRLTMAYFVAAQMMRTPTKLEEIKWVHQRLLEKFGPDCWVGEPDQKLGNVTEADAETAFLDAVAEAVPEFARLLLDKHWALLVPPAGETFYLCDNPVALQNLIDRWPRGNLGLRCKGIEVYLPLSPSMTLQMLCPQMALAAFLTDASTIASRELKPTSGLLDSHLTGFPVKLRPENVENLNSLQVIWSERFLFAHDGDFALARDMINCAPELREGPRPESEPPPPPDHIRRRLGLDELPE